MKIRPATRLHGRLRIPGDKSVSHRAVMLASIADGETRISNFSKSADCLDTVECMRALGVRIEFEDGDVVVHGVGKHGLKDPGRTLECGNSGTTMRLLTGILAAQSFDSVITGDASLCKRPMKRIIEPLTQMGAIIESDSERAPLQIKGGRKLNGITYETPVASAQVKSCVLLAGLYAEGTTRVIEKTPTRNHTELILAWMGGLSGTEAVVNGAATLTAKPITVPGDISSAAFFLVAAACLKGSDLVLEKVGVNKTRRAILDVLSNLGVDLVIENEQNFGFEPVADIRIKGSATLDTRLVLSGQTVADVIDEIPILAVMGTQIRDGLEVRDARELRIKESDRITSIVVNLKRMGASITEREDGFVIERSRLTGATLDPFGDHRIAMAFAIAGLLGDGETQVVDPECVDVSFPEFFRALASLAEER